MSGQTDKQTDRHLLFYSSCCAERDTDGDSACAPQKAQARDRQTDATKRITMRRIRGWQTTTLVT